MVPLGDLTSSFSYSRFTLDSQMYFFILPVLSLTLNSSFFWTSICIRLFKFSVSTVNTTSFPSNLFFHVHTSVHTHSQLYTRSLSWPLLSHSCLICDSSWLSHLPYWLHPSADTLCWLHYFEVIFIFSILGYNWSLGYYWAYLRFLPGLLLLLSLLSGFLLLVVSFKPLPGWLSDLLVFVICSLSLE